MQSKSHKLSLRIEASTMVFHRRSGSGTVNSSKNTNEEELLFSNVIIRKNHHIHHNNGWSSPSSKHRGGLASFNSGVDVEDSEGSSSSLFDCHNDLNFLPTCGGQDDTTTATCGSPGNNHGCSNQNRTNGLLSGSNTATVNPYHVLQVRHDATKSEIKLAYRRLALFHHPGRKLGLSCDTTATKATTSSTSTDEQQLRKKYVFEVLSACYETLICPESRRRYDIVLKLGTAASISCSNGSTQQRVRYNTILQKGLPAGEMFVGGKRLVDMVNPNGDSSDSNNNQNNLNDVDAFYRHGYYGGGGGSSNDNNSITTVSSTSAPYHGKNSNSSKTCL